MGRCEPRYPARQADGNLECRTARERDLHMIRIGAERYEIPVAVVLGG